VTLRYQDIPALLREHFGTTAERRWDSAPVATRHLKDMPTEHRRQRRRGCRGRIPGNIWSAGDEMSYILPKFDKIVIKLPAELMRTVQPSFAAQARHRGSQRERVW